MTTKQRVTQIIHQLQAYFENTGSTTGQQMVAELAKHHQVEIDRAVIAKARDPKNPVDAWRPEE